MPSPELNSPPSQRPTLEAIAREVGVSSMTASKSLRGVGRISEKMRTAIREKAEEMGYLSTRERLFPPFVKTFSGSKNELRLLCPTVGALERGELAPYRNHMIEGLKSAAEKGEGTVHIESFPTLDAMLAYVKCERIHSVVLFEPYPVRWIRSFREVSDVIYTIGHDFQEGVDSVYFNEARAAALIATRLQESGHRHIAWFGIHDRHAAFLIPDEEFERGEAVDWLAISNHGTRYAAWLYLSRTHPDLGNWPVVLVERDWRIHSLADTVKQACREIFQTRPQPTAIVCVANGVAREMITQLESMGLQVPRDISVVSYSVQETGNTGDGHQLSGLHMPMEMIGNVVPEIAQRRRAYPEGLSISIQLDSDWCPGETILPILS